MAGMITMSTLNKHPEVIEISTTTAATTLIYNTTSTSTNVTTTTTTMTTTPPIDLAMLFLCTKSPRNGCDLILNLTQEYEILKKSINSNPPQLIDHAGELSTNFDLSGEQVFESCGVTYKNKHFLFGPHKILQLKDCGLITLGTMEFDHVDGACGSTDGVIVLCFHVHTIKRCQEAPSPTSPWSELELSNYGHKQTAIATSPGDQ